MEVRTHVSEAGVAVLSEAGNITCYALRKGDYSLRFINNGAEHLSKEQAREVLNELAYKLMAAASQL